MTLCSTMLTSSLKVFNTETGQRCVNYWRRMKTQRTRKFSMLLLLLVQMWLEWILLITIQGNLRRLTLISILPVVSGPTSTALSMAGSKSQAGRIRWDLHFLKWSSGPRCVSASLRVLTWLDCPRPKKAQLVKVVSTTQAQIPSLRMVLKTRGFGQQSDRWMIPPLREPAPLIATTVAIA